jgi:hypothetical protein
MHGSEEGGNDLRWLLEPPVPGSFHLHFSAGEGTVLTADAKEALDRLIRALSDSDVEGHVMRLVGGTSGTTRQYSCKIVR